MITTVSKIAPSGKHSEVLRSPSTGITKRIFKGQRWLVVTQWDEQSTAHLAAFTSETAAKRVSDRCGRLGYVVHYVVHYVEQAEVVL